MTSLAETNRRRCHQNQEFDNITCDCDDVISCLTTGVIANSCSSRSVVNDDDASSPVYSDGYTSMTGSITLPSERFSSQSLSSNDSYWLNDDDNDDKIDDDDDYDDHCSISTLEYDDVDVSYDDWTAQSCHHTTSSSTVEDLEFDYLTKSTVVRRSSSLKCGYSDTAIARQSSSTSKKVVRFADALGLELTSIRHILDVSDMPVTSYSRLGVRRDTAINGMKILRRFCEPDSSPDFLRRVQERKVLLEELNVNIDNMTVSGAVRVANIAYQKLVTIRYTLDNWTSFMDLPTTFQRQQINASNHRYDGGLTDSFTFTLYLPRHWTTTTADFCQRLEFSIQFVAGTAGYEETFWDSNFGTNYIIDCYPTSSSIKT